MPVPSNVRDLSGERFGMLVAIKPTKSDAHGNKRYVCKCDCGIEVIVRGVKLTSGKQTNCGCVSGRPKRGAIFTRPVVDKSCSICLYYKRGKCVAKTCVCKEDTP